MNETDLFEPVAGYFQRQGYTVGAEVCHCDLVAVKDDQLAIIELKLSLNLTLISQAVKRQRMTPQVYVAIPRPKRYTRAFRSSLNVLKRLGIGLFTIHTSPLGQAATLEFKPNHDGKISKARQAALLREFSGRSIQPNIGGSVNRPVYTVYKETALTIATILAERGEQSVRDIRPIAGDKTQPILAKNHYGWFQRVHKGVYSLTDKGREALEEYPELRELALRLIDSSPDSGDVK